MHRKFLRDFFNLGGDTYGDTYKNINFDDVVKWLDVQKNHLKKSFTFAISWNFIHCWHWEEKKPLLLCVQKSSIRIKMETYLN